MKYRKLPQLNKDVSVICLGTMNWGQQNTEEDAYAQLDYAVEHGVNFIDTAEAYPIPPDPEKQGTTERYLGNWLKKRGKRDDLIIASKVAGIFQKSIIKQRDASAGYTRQNIRAAVDGSLERLGLEYLDLYQVHVPDRKANYFGIRGFENMVEEDVPSIEETLAALNELVGEGKVRAVGISNETPWGVSEYLRAAREKGYMRIATIQNQYSLINRTFEIGLSEICLRENIGLLSYSPLSGGVLSGKYLNGAKPEGARFTLFSRNSGRYNNPRVQEAVRRYVELAKKHDLDPSVMALAFVTSRLFTTSTVIGATTLEQLKTDVAAGDIKLPNEVMEEIRDIYTELPDVQV